MAEAEGLWGGGVVAPFRFYSVFCSDVSFLWSYQQLLCVDGDKLGDSLVDLRLPLRMLLVCC